MKNIWALSPASSYPGKTSGADRESVMRSSRPPDSPTGTRPHTHNSMNPVTYGWILSEIIIISQLKSQSALAQLVLDKYLRVGM